MSLTQITFENACDIIKQSTACMFKVKHLLYPHLNEDFNGDTCIELGWSENGDFDEITFDADDTYFINEHGCLIIHQMDRPYSLQFLELVKIRKGIDGFTFEPV